MFGLKAPFLRNVHWMTIIYDKLSLVVNPIYCMSYDKLAHRSSNTHIPAKEIKCSCNVHEWYE